MQRQLDRLMDDKNQLLLRLRHEELMASEITRRAQEVQEVLNRREDEYQGIAHDFNEQQEENQKLMEEEE
jgi:shikimate kinase